MPGSSKDLISIQLVKQNTATERERERDECGKIHPFQVADNHFITSALPQRNPKVCEDYANTSRKVQIHLICINLLAKQEASNISTLCMHFLWAKYQQWHTVFPWVLSLTHIHTQSGTCTEGGTYTVSLSQFPTGCSYAAFWRSIVYYYRQHNTVIMLLTALWLH